MLKSVGDWFGRLFRNPRASQIASAVFLMLAIAAWATQCHGAETGLQFGIGSTISRGETPVIDVAIRTRLGAPGDAHWQFGLTLVGTSDYGGSLEPPRSTPRPVMKRAVAEQVADAHQSNQAALSAMLVDGFGRVDVGLGVAFVQNLDIYNGSHANFSLMLAYRFQRLPITVAIRHWSNAGTKYPNLGRDFALVSWRF